MNLEIQGITLDDRFFAVPELIQYCKEEIKTSSEPGWELDVYQFILDFMNDSDVISQQTSGTTGMQKIIKLPKKAMLASAKNTVGFFQLERGDIAVLCLPIQYIAGKMMMVRAMLAGLNLKLIQPSGMPDFTNIRKIDFCAMVPMQAIHLLEKNLWPNIKTLILGGAETGKKLFEQLQHLETQVFETYGMAESCSHVALKKLNGSDSENFYTALPDVQLSTDERDCLVIEASYLPNKIVTNDTVEMLESNRFKWLGRFDNVINSGGLKIQPEILEGRIQTIMNKSCTVLGLPDEKLGQKMVLAIETSENETGEQIINKLSSHFERKLLPKEVYFIKKFPRNKSFKIDRKRLQKIILKDY